MTKGTNMATISVLLVDDEEEFLAYFKPRLETRGLNTFSASNGVDAMRIMDEHRIDVVILDVRMPGMGGLEMLRQTRQKHPLVDVIMLSGLGTVESAVEGLKLGAFDYITKPCDISDLLEKVNAAYARKEITEEKIRKAKVDKIIRHPMALFDEEK